VAWRAPAMAITLISCCAYEPGAWAQPDAASEVSMRQADQLAHNLETLERVVGLAERACLSSHTSTENAGISLTFAAILNTLKSGVGLERQFKDLRGASEQLTGAVAKLENDDIRKCMNEKLAPAFALVNTSYQPGDPAAAWPEPIDFRFNFARVVSKDPDKYSENLKVNLLRASRSPVSRRITNQFDTAGSPYYQIDISYPTDGESIKGTITPEIKGQGRLSSEPTSFTPLCLQRPPSFPKIKAEYDMFDCTEGELCHSAMLATGWLATCSPGKSGEGIAPVNPRPTRYAAFRLARADSNVVERRWVVPSLEALSERNAEGVGYTVFTLSTAAFRRPEVLGVEVDIRVNGTRVEEDGLAPEMRPAPNDPEQPFTHSFALQSLDFQGLRGGCDEVSVGLRPLYAGGSKGDSRAVTLLYAALRDVEERKVEFANDSLTWRASYITPEREWRFIPIVHSYLYPADNPALASAAASAAEADKRWLDEQRFSYTGQRIVAVVRPPRTIQPDGTAAFGLGIGLLQPTGQIRFTFPEADARSLSAFMIAQRGRGNADRVIASDQYIFQALGGHRTVRGVCGTG